MIEDGRGEVVELTAVKGSRVVGVPMRRLGMPRGSLMCAILHGDEVIIPRGDAVLCPGDVAIVITTLAARSAVLRLFKQRALS